ncbi:MAG TPA: FAD:protein FMN transferase [Clostridiales bacterium]|nr:FAD:protein FMN transferase [Clostridiales bacterium]
MNNKIIAFLSIFFLILNLTSCRKTRTEYLKDDLFALDTYITFSVIEGDRAKEGIDATKKRIREIEERMSAHLPGSDISKINDNAGKQPVKVNPDTFFVIKKALEYAELTNGSFDISLLPVSRLWNINGENPRVPSPEEIEKALAVVDYKKIRLNEEEMTVFLEDEGMAIDLGGIAKGYAGDETVRILKEHGVTSGLVNLGGNIVAVNGKEDGSPWRIGIQNPRIDEDKNKRKHVAVLDTRGDAIVTSGDYERYMVEHYEKTGERYHHIFDPETGYPAKNGVISVSIITKNAIDADALSTSLFVMGVEEGLKLANELEGVEAMIVAEDKSIYLSKGLKDAVSGIHPDYKVVN